MNKNKKEIEKRRTFGIISHPDAGKTTLTEKLLLYGGAIQQAGAIKAKKASKHATSDWMAIEKERGISVTTSVMKFRYENFEINILDTPGHKDFSEDTYRVLTAVDSALMVIDNAKGVEPQTKKLMEVCRMRNTPIVTFINKLDRDGLPPLDVLSDIEDKLQIECIPLSWPIGMGKRFKGVYNLFKKELHLFTPGRNTVARDGIVISDISDTKLDDILGTQANELREEIELIEGASAPFELKHFLKGNQTPVFFGSAINNFGIKEMFDVFLELAPSPGQRTTVTREVSPYEESFSGFAFKIQANMNPAHRDRIAFIRICSGKFTRGMKVVHHRIGKEVIFSNATIFMANERENVSEAYPGDIIGIHNHGTIKIGDTFSEKEPLTFCGIPNFSPEFFKKVVLTDPMRAKHLKNGLAQLAEEGVIQVFKPVNGNDYILGAVGILQFDITIERLKSEYQVDTVYEPVNYTVSRWIKCDNLKKMKEFEKNNRTGIMIDAEGSKAYLTTSEWQLNYCMENWPDIKFFKTREILINSDAS